MAKKKVEKVELDTLEMVNAPVDAQDNAQDTQEQTFIPLTFEEIKEKITVKSKCGLADKKAIVQIVENTCVEKDEVNGVFYVDRLMERVGESFGVLQYYTNFYDVIENASDYTYDYLYECGLFDYIIDEIDDTDYDMLVVAIGDIYVKVQHLNSLGSCLYRIVDKTIKELPNMKDINKMLKGLPKILNGIDKDTLSIFAKELGNGTIANSVMNKDNIVDITDINK